MNKILISVVTFLIISISSYAQNVGTIVDDTLVNYVDINNKKQGKWIKYYDNGQMKYTGNFVNDIPVGTFYYYFPNKKTKSILKYDENRSSTVEIFWQNGNRFATGAYNPDHKRIGKWNIYYEDGTISKIINYKDGKPDGSVLTYFPGGIEKLFDVEFKDGKMNGPYKKYFKGNILQEEGTCENGLRHGYWKFYNPEGLIDQEGIYVNGKREGDWITHRHDIAASDTVNYINGIAENNDELMKEWDDKLKWAKENQDKFKDPMDYLDDPFEFFMDNK